MITLIYKPKSKPDAREIALDHMRTIPHYYTAFEQWINDFILVKNI